MEFLANLNQLLFPTRCISCSQLGETLCQVCRGAWRYEIQVVHIARNRGTELTVRASLLYSPIVQKVLLGAKESGQKACDRLISEAISFGVGDFLSSQSCDYLIPIPSRVSVVRKRGRNFIEEIAQMASTSFRIPVINSLAFQRSVRDQSQLGFGERWNNVEGAMVVKAKSSLSGDVLLVDDLLTTGATLSEAARALRYAGFTVKGAVTAALAQPVR